MEMGKEKKKQLEENLKELGITEKQIEECGTILFHCLFKSDSHNEAVNNIMKEMKKSKLFSKFFVQISSIMIMENYLKRERGE